MIRPLPALRVYLLMEVALAAFFGMIFTASQVYQIDFVGLTPLQLVLVGTTLELSIFLFEIPTGVVADVYSRRLSIIIGILLIGLGFLVEGTFPIFGAILAAQVLWGVGYTFTSGATQAWITDEIGEDAAASAFLRSTQLGLIAELCGLVLGVMIGSLQIYLPIRIGGLLIAGLGLLLIAVMPETGFQPAAREQRGTWHSLMNTFRDGWNTVRGRPALIMILTVGLVFGLYSEGFDRLWTKHLLEGFASPFGGVLRPVVLIGAIRAVSMLLSSGVVGLAHRRLHIDQDNAPARAIWGAAAALVAALFAFAAAGSLGMAVVAYWVISAARNLIYPLYTGWINRRLEPQVRATVLSMSGQVDAVGQIVGGPGVGLIGSLVSVRAALLASAAILSPVLPLISHSLRLNEKQPARQEPAAGEEI